MHQRVARVVREMQPDLLYAQLIRMGPYRPRERPCFFK